MHLKWLFRISSIDNSLTNPSSREQFSPQEPPIIPQVEELARWGLKRFRPSSCFGEIGSGWVSNLGFCNFSARLFFFFRPLKKTLRVLGGAIRGASPGMMYFPILNEELFGSQESSKSQGSWSLFTSFEPGHFLWVRYVALIVGCLCCRMSIRVKYFVDFIGDELFLEKMAVKCFRNHYFRICQGNLGESCSNSTRWKCIQKWFVIDFVTTISKKESCLFSWDRQSYQHQNN